jgi:hypothetical protein
MKKDDQQEIQLHKLKKNVFLQPEKGSIAHPDSYWEDRANPRTRDGS